MTATKLLQTCLCRVTTSIVVGALGSLVLLQLASLAFTLHVVDSPLLLLPCPILGAVVMWAFVSLDRTGRLPGWRTPLSVMAATFLMFVGAAVADSFRTGTQPGAQAYFLFLLITGVIVGGLWLAHLGISRLAGECSGNDATAQ